MYLQHRLLHPLQRLFTLGVIAVKLQTGDVLLQCFLSRLVKSATVATAALMLWFVKFG
jgi:hypothetical protein